MSKLRYSVRRFMEDMGGRFDFSHSVAQLDTIEECRDIITKDMFVVDNDKEEIITYEELFPFEFTEEDKSELLRFYPLCVKFEDLTPSRIKKEFKKVKEENQHLKPYKLYKTNKILFKVEIAINKNHDNFGIELRSRNGNSLFVDYDLILISW